MNKWQVALFTFIGILGGSIVLYGLLTQPIAQLYYVTGASLLLVTAIYFKFTFFVALELILLAGHSAILLGIGPVLQIVIPILLTAQFLAYYLLSGQLKNIFRLIGIIGIALLSIAFAYENQWIFLYGSLAISIFAFYQVYQKRWAALIWAVLNSIYVFIAAYKLML